MKIENRKSKIKNLRQAGFSLTEVLLAAGILVVGFLLICSTLPVGIHLTAQATERSIAPVVADEAFAKIRLFGITPVKHWPAAMGLPSPLVADPNIMHVEYSGFSYLGLSNDEFAYPSTDIRPDVKKYYWSAILRYNLRDHNEDSFQVTVFVSRISGLGLQYPLFDRLGRVKTPQNAPWYSPFPRPVLIQVAPQNPVSGYTKEIRLSVGPTDPDLVRQTVTEDSILVDDRSGQIMHVIDRDPADPAVLFLDGNVFDADIDRDGQLDAARYVWVIPPAVGGGRQPCIGVSQKTIKFDPTP